MTATDPSFLTAPRSPAGARRSSTPASSSTACPATSPRRSSRSAPGSASARRDGCTATSRLTRDDVLGARAVRRPDRAVRRPDRGPSRRRRTPAGRTSPPGSAVGIPFRALVVRDAVERPRRRALLLGDPRRPRLGPLDGPVHGDGPGCRHRGGDGGHGSAAGGAVRAVAHRRASPAGSPPTARSSSCPRSGAAPHDLRPDRPRRHRPGGPRRHVRPRAPRDRRRPAGRAARRTSCSPTSTGWRPSWRDGARRRASGRRSTRCRPTAAGTRPSSPSCRGGPASTSSPRPASTTSGSTGPSHWSLRATEDELADLFVADVEDGHRRARLRRPDRPPDGRPRRRSSRSPAATAVRRPATVPIFRAAAATHRRTGVPIHTHCEAGTGALEQLRRPRRRRRPGRRAISLSHVDKVVDRGYHRELLVDRRVRRLRPGLPLGRPRQRHAPAHRVGGRGRHRIGQVMLGHGCGPPGLLPVVRRSARAGVPARASSATSWTARGIPAAVRDVDVRRRTGPGVRVCGGGADEPAQEPLLTSVVGSHAHPGWFAARDRGGGSAASSARPISRSCSTTASTSRSATRSGPGST